MRIAACLVLVASSAPAAAQGPQITPEDWSAYIDWRDGCEDSRLEGKSESVKLRKIARTLGMSGSELERIVNRVEPMASVLQKETETSISAAMAQTPLKDRILKVEVNLETNHPIAWVKWRCGDMRDVDKEASYVAWAVSDGGSVVKTLGLWCVNEIDTKLFSAKIGNTAFRRISKAAIERFAASRYIRLFEEVKRGPHR